MMKTETPPTRLQGVVESNVDEGKSIARDAQAVAEKKVEKVARTHGKEIEDLTHEGQRIADDLGLDGEFIVQTVQNIVNTLQDAARDVKGDKVVQIEAARAMANAKAKAIPSEQATSTIHMEGENPVIATVPVGEKGKGTGAAFHASVALRRALGITEDSREEVQTQLQTLFQSLKQSDNVLSQLIESFQTASSRADITEIAVALLAVITDSIRTLRAGGELGGVLQRAKVLISDEIGEDAAQNIADAAATILETSVKHENFVPSAVNLIREIKDTLAKDGEIASLIERSQALLEGVKDQLVPFITDELLAVQIPGIAMSIKKMKQVFDVTLQNMHLSKITVDPTNVGIVTDTSDNSGKLVIGIKNVDITVKNIQWDAKQQNWPHLHDHGDAEVTLENGSVAIVAEIRMPTNKADIFTEGVKVIAASSRISFDKLNLLVNPTHHEIIVKLLLKLFNKTMKQRMMDEMNSEMQRQSEKLNVKLNSIVNGILNVSTTVPPPTPEEIKQVSTAADADKKNIEKMVKERNKDVKEQATKVSEAIDHGLDKVQDAASSLVHTVKEFGESGPPIFRENVPGDRLQAAAPIVAEHAQATAGQVQHATKVAQQEGLEAAETLRQRLPNAKVPLDQLQREAIDAFNAAAPHAERVKEPVEHMKQQMLGAKEAVQPQIESSKEQLKKLKEEAKAAKDEIQPIVEKTVSRVKETVSSVQEHVKTAEEAAAKADTVPSLGGGLPPEVDRTIQQEQRAVHGEMHELMKDVKGNIKESLSVAEPHVQKAREPLKVLQENVTDAAQTARPFVTNVKGDVAQIGEEGRRAMEAVQPHIERAKEHGEELKKEGQKALEDIRPNAEAAQKAIKDAGETAIQHGAEASHEVRAKEPIHPGASTFGVSDIPGATHGVPSTVGRQHPSTVGDVGIGLQQKPTRLSVAEELRSKPTTADVTHAREIKEDVRETTDKVKDEATAAKEKLEGHMESAKREAQDIKSTLREAGEDVKQHGVELQKELETKQHIPTGQEVQQGVQQEVREAAEDVRPRVSELRERFDNLGDIAQQAKKDVQPHIERSLEEIQKKAA